MRASPGTSLLEVLVTLTIIATVAGIAVAGRDSQRNGLVLEQRVAQVVSDAATARQRAVAEAVTKTLRIEGAGCNGGVGEIRFFPDGTARGAALCFEEAGLSRRLTVAPLTGRLLEHEHK